MDSRDKKGITILVEGAGHVVQHNYGPALFNEKKLYGDNLQIVFTDYHEKVKKEHAATNLEIFLAELDGWAAYINKGTPEGQKAYESLDPDVVFVATPDVTHVQTAFNWLTECDKPRHIFIEKPIDSSLSRSRVLQYYFENQKAGEKGLEVFAIDHYLARFLPFHFKSVQNDLQNKLGGSIESLKFYLLEDRSGPYIGPIEKDNRSSSLQKGLILDLFPHVLAILTYFGSIQSVKIRGLKVARYQYQTKDEVVPASIPKETFAHICFSFIGGPETRSSPTRISAKDCQVLRS